MKNIFLCILLISCKARQSGSDSALFAPVPKPSYTAQARTFINEYVGLYKIQGQPKKVDAQMKHCGIEIEMDGVRRGEDIEPYAKKVLRDRWDELSDKDKVKKRPELEMTIGLFRSENEKGYVGDHYFLNSKPQIESINQKDLGEPNSLKSDTATFKKTYTVTSDILMLETIFLGRADDVWYSSIFQTDYLSC